MSLTPESLDQLVRQALDHRDRCAQSLVHARQIVRVLKQAATVAKGGPRVRGRYRQTRQSTKSLALACVAVGVDAPALSEQTGISIERLGVLFGGAKATDQERTALSAVLPTWEPVRAK